MIEQQAVVLQLRGERAILKIANSSGCHGCQLNSGCGVGSIGRMLGHRQDSYCIHNDDNLKIGDRVVIGIPETNLATAGFIMYLFPLLLLFLFAISADFLFSSDEILTLLSAVTGLVAGLFLTPTVSNKLIKTDLQARFLRHQNLSGSCEPETQFSVK